MDSPDVPCGRASILGRVQFAFFRNLLLLGLTGFILLRRRPGRPDPANGLTSMTTSVTL